MWITKLTRAVQRKINKRDMTGVQAGARADKDASIHYNSVHTLDPYRLAQAFAAADTGDLLQQYQLFDLIEQHDPHIYAELAKRRRAITGLGWSLQPPQDASQAELRRTKELEQVLRDIPRFEDAHYDLTDAIGKGLTALEIEWQTGDLWRPQALHYVPAWLLTLEHTTGTLQYRRNGIGEDLLPDKWVVHEHRALSCYIERAALFRVLGWTYAYKAYNVYDMQRFLERYGIPLRLGKFPAGTPAAQQDALLRAVRNIGSDGAGIVTDTMQIDFLAAKSRGQVTDFLDAITYWERKQSIAILGSTLTSQADGKTSTNALGQVHNEMRKEILLHDVAQLAPTIQRQLVLPLAQINGMFAPERLPHWVYDTEDTPDQQALVDVFTRASALGMRIPLDWAHQELQIPQAADDEPVLALGSSGSSDTDVVADVDADVDADADTDDADIDKDTDAATNMALAKAQSRPRSKPQSGHKADIVPAYIAQLSVLAAPYESALTDKIAAIVADSASFEEALQRLDDLTVAHDRTPLAEQIAQALAASHLAGRAAGDTLRG